MFHHSTSTRNLDRHVDEVFYRHVRSSCLEILLLFVVFPAIARPLSLIPEGLRAEIRIVNAFPRRDLHLDPRQPLEIRPRSERRSEQEQ